MAENISSPLFQDWLEKLISQIESVGRAAFLLAEQLYNKGIMSDNKLMRSVADKTKTTRSENIDVLNDQIINIGNATLLIGKQLFNRGIMKDNHVMRELTAKTKSNNV